ncbi:MAG: helix-turn-helix transcriptional regulator [Bacteroidia bacterium]
MKEDDKNDEEEYREVVGKIVKKYRKLNGMSQTDLARVSDLGITTINEIENGRANFSAETIISVLRPLRINFTDALKILLKDNPPDQNP